MNSADVIAYTDSVNSCRLCPDCAESEPDQETLDPIFADNSDEINGETCENCRSFYTSSNGWQPYTEVEYFHWVRCTSCNHVEPVPADDARVRLAYMRGERCPCCGKRTLHYRVKGGR